MAYRDLDKRRATTKARVRRFRERQAKGAGVTDISHKALRVHTQVVTESITLADLDADGNAIPEY